ncbi:YfiT family bacillithiol transferase [Bacillus sp. FJAT-49736]|uniref:YfiT family bacillithiol transferase n=1 Tax=Bacillus sp. FJAT-49736 TaxID=2833582 RepID=UPI001BC8D376|nr:putative metal-dependent hydrolase [Bacillus sp. FJAT-49736]MBS4172912.1 putative metal-dependent hydrolase [Bacillus sp. FJAT-49736]
MNKQYPIGKFEYNQEINEQVVKQWMREIDELPDKLQKAVQELSEEQLDTPYREGGWTIRQLVHHIADSHMNAYIRMKLALTEENPTIKPYHEGKWAEQSDYLLPIEFSLTILAGLHKRWSYLLQNLNSHDWKKTFNHPDSGEITIEKNIGLYAWHGNHHLAHITSLCREKGWI